MRYPADMESFEGSGLCNTTNGSIETFPFSCNIGCDRFFKLVTTTVILGKLALHSVRLSKNLA
jgi:hypothetical protein